MKSTAIVWTVVGVVVVIGGLVWLSSISESDTSGVNSSSLSAVATDDYVRGVATSTVTLIEYLDFECPACGAYYPVLKQLEGEYGDRVTFVVRYFPLPMHRNGLASAYAAEAAGRQGKFWEMHDLLLSRQSTWINKQVSTPEVFEGYAQELGLDMQKYKADVASSEVKERINRDIHSGQKLGVNGTPTFFLNGKAVRPAGYEPFKALIETELQL